MSRLEDAFAIQIRLAKLPKPEREARLIAGRRFRSDFAWRRPPVVVEVDGGVYSGGRHTRGKGFTNDCEKCNLLTLAGFRVLRVTREHIEDGRALAWLREALG